MSFENNYKISGPTESQEGPTPSLTLRNVTLMGAHKCNVTFMGAHKCNVTSSSSVQVVPALDEPMHESRESLKGVLGEPNRQ